MLSYSQKRSIHLALWDYYCSVKQGRTQPNAFLNNLAKQFPEIAKDAKEEAENTFKALERAKSRSI